MTPLLEWSLTRPKGERCEPVAGKAGAIAPGRLAHAQVGYRVNGTLDDARRARGLPQEALPSGSRIQIGTFSP